MLYTYQTKNIKGNYYKLAGTVNGDLIETNILYILDQIDNYLITLVPKKDFGSEGVTSRLLPNS